MACARLVNGSFSCHQVSFVLLDLSVFRPCHNVESSLGAIANIVEPYNREVIDDPRNCFAISSYWGRLSDFCVCGSDMEVYHEIGEISTAATILLGPKPETNSGRASHSTDSTSDAINGP